MRPRESAVCKRVFLVCWLTMFFVTGGVQSNADDEGNDAEKDYDKLVASLENHNPQPTLLGEAGPNQRPLFSKDYDWKEQDRVLKTIQFLVDHAEEAWPALVEHLDDQRYCITFRRDQSVSHYLIGTVCYVLVKENLTAGYLRLLPKDEVVVRKLRNPDVFPSSTDPQRFKAWCSEQHDAGRALYALQIEMCQWAVDRLPKLNLRVPGEQSESITAIEKRIEELRTTKKPMLIRKIVNESRSPYSQRSAEAIRAVFESK